MSLENETEAETKVVKCGEASKKGGEAKRIVLSTVRGGPVTRHVLFPTELLQSLQQSLN